LILFHFSLFFVSWWTSERKHGHFQMVCVCHSGRPYSRLIAPLLLHLRSIWSGPNHCLRVAAIYPHLSLSAVCLPRSRNRFAAKEVKRDSGKKLKSPWEMASFHPKNPEIKRSFHSLLSRRKHGVISQGAV
jgi:hypothetical protein